jgi:hypothetical protein
MVGLLADSGGGSTPLHQSPAPAQTGEAQLRRSVHNDEEFHQRYDRDVIYENRPYRSDLYLEWIDNNTDDPRELEVLRRQVRAMLERHVPPGLLLSDPQRR